MLRKVTLGVLVLVLAMNVVGATDVDYSIDEDVSNLWIKDSWSGGGENIYYVEKTDGYSPDGEAVFDFYDGFEGSDLDAEKWDASGSVTVSDSTVILDNNDFIIGCTSYGFGYITETRSKANEQDVSFVSLRTSLDSTTTRLELISTDALLTTEFGALHYKDGLGESGDVISGWDEFQNNYYTYGIKNLAASNVVFTQNDNSFQISTYIPSVPLYPAVRVWDSSQESTLTVDWIRVRKYASNSPTVTVSDKTTYYEVKISSTDTLTDYQVPISCSSLGITSATESVHISDTPFDTTPPNTVTGLSGQPSETFINWYWSNPNDPDFDYSCVYLDGVWQTNTSAEVYKTEGLAPDTSYTLSTQTVDTYGNINTNWVNATISTTKHVGEYSQYNTMLWDGEDSGFGFVENLYDVMIGLSSAVVFWLIVLPLPFLAAWIKQQSVIIPSIMYMVIGGSAVAIMPVELAKPAWLMLALSITGIIYHLFKQRY